MRRGQTRRHGLDSVFVLLLFGVFACCLMLVLLTGARSYKSVADRGEVAYEQRICTQYIATKVRHNDYSGGVTVGPFSAEEPELSTLFLHQTIEGEDYWVRIYCYDGTVRELFTEANQAMEPEDGQEVMTASALHFTLEEGLLTITAADTAGQISELSLLLRSGEEAAS